MTSPGDIVRLKQPQPEQAHERFLVGQVTLGIVIYRSRDDFQSVAVEGAFNDACERAPQQVLFRVQLNTGQFSNYCDWEMAVMLYETFPNAQIQELQSGAWHNITRYAY